MAGGTRSRTRAQGPIGHAKFRSGLARLLLRHSTAVDHFAAARALDVAGIDIYHPTQDRLTGTEIALGGDLARSMRHGQNYLLLETEAQGFPEWTPYPGQLRLQAFSHLASGANMIEYWHWGTTANAVETYWRGLLSQDFKPNPTYERSRNHRKKILRASVRNW